MKDLLKLIFICSIITSCAQNTKNNMVSSDLMKDIKQVPKAKQITYAIHVNAKTPYEIYIDDIPLPGFGRCYESGMNTTLELNPYLLGNGIHKLKVRYLPLETAKDGLLQPSDVYFNKDAKWNIFFVSYIKDTTDPLGYKGEIDYENSELTVVPPPNAVPFWDQVFELDIKDLPYELEGWSNSQDLSKIDEDKLSKGVFSFYNEIREVMNNGDVEKYFNMNSKSDKEIAVATFDNDLEWYTSDERKNEIINDCKDNMLPINKEDYNLKIYGYGKIIAIERIKKFKNNSLIARKRIEDNTRYFAYSFKLHKPKGSDTFEIIRK
ncbi:hypothetical protein [Aquimarina agarivorans]|uniref:hypothetical protein n=1 Tax=Aquimarina agarivorans TaxID=980584 RepID=UPI000248E8D5|nr:hypothetical protein [Aquimarina agarivorans]